MEKVILIWKSEYGTEEIIVGFCTNEKDADMYINAHKNKHTKFRKFEVNNLIKKDVYFCYNCKKMLNESDTFNTFDESGIKYKACNKCGQMILPSCYSEVYKKICDFFEDCVKQVCNLYTEDPHFNIPENLEEKVAEIWEEYNRSTVVEKIITDRALFDKAPDSREEKEAISEVIDDLTNIIMDQYRKDNNIESSDSDEDDFLYTNVWNDIHNLITLH